MTTATTLLLLALARVPADAEVVAVAAWYGVDPAVALAVAEVETGHVPAALRDVVVSKGNVGRTQVNATTWYRTFGYASRPEFVSALQNRHTNIRAGVSILRYIQDRRAAPDGTCLCNTHAGSWTAHYNEGGTVTAQGERYGLRVASKVRRMRAAMSAARW